MTGDRFDVVVVGSGVSGSSAAATAAAAGLRVAVVEKLAEPGGSAALSAGMFWTAPDLESLRARIPLGDPARGRRLVEDYRSALADVRATGIRVADDPQTDIMTFGIGYSLDIRALLAHCRDRVVAAGGEILLSSPVTAVAPDGDGWVVETATAGGPRRLSAGAVVLASGGFQGDPELLARYVGRNADRLLLRSNPGSVGDGLRLARGNGAGGTGAMSTFYGHLIAWPLQRWTTEDFLPYSQYYSESTVLLNLAGERFVDETLGDEILNQDLTFQRDGLGVLVLDEHVRSTEAVSEPFPGLGEVDRLELARQAGARVATADTLDELVELIGEWGIDPVAARRSLETYVDAVRDGRRSSEGVPVGATARAPQDPPFHAVMVQPSITFTFGGIPTDDAGRVLDRDRHEVPGLFAAGADIGGLSNYGYAGGIAPGYITGRWAGESAARYARSAASTPEPTGVQS
ncbi:Fumarate reductase flavoprotein subunit [Actinomycetales bacterium JB111]|nr:Fumarate reductase flavoprotein subunit [Actinomycetales bacterium JB111]